MDILDPQLEALHAEPSPKGDALVEISNQIIKAIEMDQTKPQGWDVLADTHMYVLNCGKAYGCYLHSMQRAEPGSYLYCKGALHAYELITDPTIEGRPDDWPKPDWVTDPEMLYYIAIQCVQVLGPHNAPGAWRMKGDALKGLGQEADSAYARCRRELAKRVRSLAGAEIGKPPAKKEEGEGEEDEEVAPWGSAAAMIEHGMGIKEGLFADDKGEIAMPVRSYAPMSLPPLGIGGCVGKWAGGVDNPTERDQIQTSMGDGIGQVPVMRYDYRQIIEEMGEKNLSSTQLGVIKHGGFVTGAELFDNQFFGISPAEAGTMDPQQRLLLDLGFQALHMATWRKTTLMGGDTGVWLGIERPDWAMAQPPEARGSVYAITGDNTSAAAGRISFCLGMQGPCSTIDTACSSSLVCLHTAARATRNGECGATRFTRETMQASALATAVSLKLLPHGTLGAASAGMLSADGRSKTLDNSANGYMRTESVSAVVLRHHDDATGKSVPPFEPLVASSEIRQDGRSASLTAPNGSAQRILHERVLQAASISFAEITWLELHGTGTPLGDPTETGAVATVHSKPLEYGQPPRRSPLAIIAAKANVGHAEAPSGFVGLLRVYGQMLGSGCPTIFGNAKLREINPLVDEAFKNKGKMIPGDIEVFNMPTQTTQASMLNPSSTCFAGISSFGFSGTIAHGVMRHCDFDEPYRGETLALSRIESRMLKQFGMAAI